MDFGIASVAAITVIAYIVGMCVSASGINNKWIPIVCGFVGGALGIVGMLIMPDFPATDYITAVAVGIVSGLAATGADQVVKQLRKTNIDYKTGFYNVVNENSVLLQKMEEMEIKEQVRAADYSENTADDDLIPNKVPDEKDGE